MTKPIHWIRFFNVLIIFVLAGCTVVNDEASLQIATATQASILPSTTPSSVPIATPSATNTALVPDPFVDKCPKLLNNPPPPVETANHRLLLREDQAPYPAYLLNPAGGMRKPISDPNLIWIFVSPDHQKIAYNAHSMSNPNLNKIVIMNAEAKILRSLPWEQDWTFFWGWLDNDHLMVTRKADKESTALATLVVLGISDNTSQELIQADYPGIDWVNFVPWQHNHVIYDPSLGFAVYPSGNGDAITLLDLADQKIVAVLPANVSQTRQPEWSPDGNYVILAGTTAQRKGNISGLTYKENYNQELFLLDKSGNVTRLTYFTDKYDNVWIGSASWSPDGQHIAFWFSIGDSLQEQLAVLDIETRQVTKYCMTGFDLSMGNSPRPVWSSDSRLVLVNNKESQEAPNKVIWVNIENGQGAVMDTGVSVEGWLTSE